MRRAISGVQSGVWGLFAMAGVSFTIRRLVEPTQPIKPTHYEHVAKTAVQMAAPDRELDRETQIRLGELAHVGAGAFWGLVLAAVTQPGTLRPLVHGTVYGTVLWILAFGGYMPAFGISKSLAEMDGYERARTWASHAVYAVVTCMALSSTE